MIDFDRLIEQHLKRESYPKTTGRYYPSEIGGCMRKIWFSYKQPVAPQADTVRIFHLGNMIHSFIAEVLMSDKTPEVELVQSEVPVKMTFGDITVSGRIDDLMRVKADGKEYLLEVKSTKWLGRQNEPSPIHMMQLQLYMHAQDVPRGILLYMEKNTLKSKSFEVAYEPDMAHAAIERFKKLHAHVKDNSMPPAEAMAGDGTRWMCDYCDYRGVCEKAGA